MSSRPLYDAIRGLRPILYWRGYAGTTGIWRDHSGRGNHSTASAGTIVRQVAADVPGDPLTAWAAGSTTANVQLGGAISGFSNSTGTILVVVYVKDFASGLAFRGFFDTAPAAVGALRLFTSDDFTTMRRDVGGEAAAAAFSNAVYQGRFQLNGARRFRMLALRWTGGVNNVVMDGSFISDSHTMTVTPASTNFHWGSINGASLSSFSVFHSVAVWNRALSLQELAYLHRAMLTPARVESIVTAAPAVVLPYWGARVG